MALARSESGARAQKIRQSPDASSWRSL